MASTGNSSNSGKPSKEPNGGDNETKQANPGVAFGEQRVPYIIQCVETYDREALLAGKGAIFHVQRTMVNPTISELVAQAKADFGHGGQVPVQPKPNEGFPAGACAGCGSAKGKDGGNLQQCGRCKSRKYCGKKCQKKDWPKHRAGCKQA